MSVLLLGLNEGVVRVDAAEQRGELVLDARQVWSVAVDRSQPERGYATTWQDGLWRTEDGGRNWQRCGLKVDHNLTRVAVGSVRDGELGVVYVGTEPSALFRSTDGGDSFEEMTGLQEIPSRDDWSFPPRPHTSHVWTIVVDPLDPDCLHVGIELGGIVSSFDGGITWRDRQPGADRDCHTLRMHAAAPGRLYEVGGAWYAESRDQGQTWTRDLEGIPEELRYFYSLVVDPGDPDTRVMTASRDPFTGHYSTPPERAWSTVYRRTADTAWQEVDNGLPAHDGNAMGWFTCDEHTEGVMFYVTPRGTLHWSRDGGDTWERLPWEPGAQLPEPMIVRSIDVVHTTGAEEAA